MFVFPTVMILLSVLFQPALSKDRRLVAEGTPAVAVITNCSAKGRWFSAKYQFCTEDGKVTTGSSSYESRREIGANIWIIYLRENPEQNRAYPTLNYRVAQ